MAKRILPVVLLLFFASLSFAQTSLQGKLTDEDNGEPILFATIAIYKNGVLITGTETDFDGNYNINTLDPGTYDVEASYTGYSPNKVVGVIVLSGKVNKLDFKMNSGVMLGEVVVTEYKVPLIEQDNTTQGGIVTGEEIANLPTRSLSGIIANTAGVSSADEGDAISFRGARTNSNVYYVDGVRVSANSLPPATEIEQLETVTGGLSAEFGDATGGFVSITTRGPSGKFTGGLELESSQYLDAFGHNLINANISGPILKNKKGQSILGFRFSGQYRHQLDDDAPAIPVYKVKDEVLREIEANPIVRIDGSNIPAAEFLTNEDVDALNYKPDEESTRLDFNGKIDARINDNINLSFSGGYNNTKNKFTPSNARRLLNTHNNPTSERERIRASVRFRHRLGRTSTNPDEAGKQKSSIIRNASYSLQFGYEKTTFNVSDPRHGDRLFDYGYVGDFDFSWMPVAGQVDPALGLPFNIGHVGYLQVFNGYEAGGQNPVRAAYNNVLDLSGDGNLVFNDFVARNGFTSGTLSSVWQLHSNAGTVYNQISKNDNETYTFNVNSTFDFAPGGSDKGVHSISFGLLYEQRFRRGYNIRPNGLWTVAQLQANERHINGLDTTNVIGNFDTGIPGIGEIPQYAPNVDELEGLLFYKKVREVTGQALDEYVNVDGIDPNLLSLDMFSAGELNDAFSQVGLDYWGFDYLGNKLSDDVSFDDFFTAEKDGIRTFPVAAAKPIYSAAYLQDKFTFRDIIFRVGLRVDRYDANTKVLKDPYSLYEVMSAKDFYNQVGGERPGGIEDDFKVYVESEGSSTVRAYRDEDRWYFANGTPANDGNLIFGGELVFPKYTDDRAEDEQFITSRDFDPSVSFEDYQPQINWAPRLAFSFPISDEANFFAHYDVLVARPQSNTLATALDYYYFNNNQRTPENNPNLKPVRTIDYEVGFQQKLSSSSKFSVSAYYREMRDMIQLRTYLFLAAPITSYTAYDNLDFGTVKGFSFSYDLRRTNNIRLTTSYTLQFADGTGSNAQSQRGLTDRGNIRNLFPLDFDERHRFNANIDYRYRSGKLYNGPRWFGKDIFANAGINLQALAVSGRPYTAKIQPTVLSGAGTIGSINGARKPWQYRLDLRIDKSFSFSKPDGKRSLGINVYLRVQNLLDTRNVIFVYPASGTATDDGYLNSPNGLDARELISTSGRNVDAYLAAYSWRVLNPNAYSLPRRIFLGTRFNF